MSLSLLQTALVWLSWACLLTGAFFGLSGAIGMFRYPDFFTRLHATSVADTMATGLIVLGLVLQADSWMMVIKLFLVLAILLYTYPTTSHSLAKAARRAGLQPLLRSE